MGVILVLSGLYPLTRPTWLNLGRYGSPDQARLATPLGGLWTHGRNMAEPTESRGKEDNEKIMFLIPYYL